MLLLMFYPVFPSDLELLLPLPGEHALPDVLPVLREGEAVRSWHHQQPHNKKQHSLQINSLLNTEGQQCFRTRVGLRLKEGGTRV
jgi:hypothetical protein